MDRTILKGYFLEKSPPDWPCPTCKKSLLRIKPGTFHREEGRHSREAHEHEAWDPEWIRHRYACLLQCTNDACGEIVANVGMGTVDYDVTFDRSGEPEYEYADFFRPMYFNPPLHLIDVPNECPETVSEKLKESFSMFFSSPEASANAARGAIELLVTELGVKLYQMQGGKRRPLNLHARIDMISTTHTDIKEMLLAVKWLGNAGSHAGIQLTPDDVADAYELIEHILAELYGGKAKAMKALAKKVNKRKGPKK